MLGVLLAALGTQEQGLKFKGKGLYLFLEFVHYIFMGSF